MESEMRGAEPIRSATAIVSPIARPRPRTTAPTMPASAYGISAWRIVSQRVAPRATAASFCPAGTSDSAARGAAEKRDPADDVVHRTPDVLREERHEHDEAPEAVDDARHRREELHHV